MSKEIELVEEHCPEDCIYRQPVRSLNTEGCFYSVMENKLRGCKISECDKYKRGNPKKARMKFSTEIYWIYEVDEDGTDDTI